MNKLKQIGIAVGLIGLLSSCSKAPENKVEKRTNQVYDVVHVDAIQRHRDNLVNTVWNHVWGWDVDGDGSIDEAIQVQNYYPGCLGLDGALANIPGMKRGEWKHLIWPPLREKSYLTTDNSRDMTESERATLNTAYALTVQEQK